jgi:diguanylate cyclase (GGDEF)-like protein/PAS domain S-box-containing protein
VAPASLKVGAARADDLRRVPRATITPAHDTAGHLAPFQAELSRRLGFTFAPAVVIVAAWLVLPHAARANELGILALFVLGGAVIAAALVSGRVLRHRHGIAIAFGLATTLVSGCVALSGDPDSIFPLFYFWFVPLSFCFLALRPAIGQVALMGVTLGAAVASIGDAPDRLVTWLGVVISTLALGAVLRVITASLREAEDRFRRTFEDAPIGMSITGLDLRVLQVNAALCAFLGREERDLVGLHVSEFSHPDDMPANLALHAELLDGTRSHYKLEKRYPRDGGEVWGQLTVSLLVDGRGRPRFVQAQIEDITDRRRDAEALDRRARFGVAASELGRMALTATGVQELADRTSAAVAEVLGVDSCTVMAVAGEELHVLSALGPNAGRRRGERWTMQPGSLGRLALDHEGPLVVHIREDAINASVELLGSGVQSAMAVSVEGREGPVGILTVYSLHRRDFTGQETGFLHVVANIMGSAIERAAREADALHRALHDPLTGLPNRDLFADRLQLALARARRGGQWPAVLIADLDQFKFVNDSLGHPAGDEFLRVLAPRLAASLRSVDTVARFGGDEFVVLCDGVEGPLEAMMLARRLAEVAEAPVDVAGSPVHLTASVGVTVAGPDSDVESLIRDADTAMYRAKGHGRGRCELFDAPMRAEVTARLELEIGLRKALEEGRLALHYQPMVELRTGTPTALEALMRWTHPVRGPVSPSEFIPVAEESGLIVPLGRWALREACAQAVALGDAGLPVSVNLSPRQLSHPGLVADVKAALADSGLDPRRLWLELTESVLLDERGSPLATLNELKALGVTLLLDDFGTGYSSLARLQHFPLDVIKIDRSFVAEMTTNPRAAALVAAVVTMATSLGLLVMPEGIETEAQREALLELGCSHGQGYLFARPMPAAELARLLPAPV